MKFSRNEKSVGYRKFERGSESAFFEVVSPAFYVIRFFGLAPYAYPGFNRPPKLLVSNLYCSFSILWALIHGYVTATTLKRYSGSKDFNGVVRFVESLKVIVNYCFLVTDISLTVLNREKFVDVWNSLWSVDERFGTACSPDPRQTRLLLWFAATLSTVLWTLVSQSGIQAFDEPYLRNVSYLMLYVGSYLSVFKFCGTVFLLHQRLRYLEVIARRQQQQQRGSLLRARKADTLLVVAKDVEQSFHQLLVAMHALNEAYTSSLMVFYLYVVTHVISNSFFVMNQAVTGLGRNAKVILCELIWLSVFLLELFSVHVACSCASYKGNDVIQAIFDWRKEIFKRDPRKNFDSSLHLLNENLFFTVAGYFKIDLPAITSMSHYFSTLVLLLVQIAVDLEDW